MRILVAIDGSECSNVVLDKVARQPWPPESEVRVVTVDAPMPAGMLQGTSNAFDDLVREQRLKSLKVLTSASAALAAYDTSLQITSAVLEGTPKDAIVAEAERFEADLVAVGSHGYGPIRRYFLGSVSQFVAHNAPCSVLIVR